MRQGACALALSLFASASAGEGIFGTKASPMPAADSGSPVGVFPAIQMVLALVLVLVMVKWVMPLFLKRYGNRIKQGSGSGIRVEETATVGPANLSVVTVRGRTLLLGSTNEKVTCLADLTQTPPEPTTFQELLDESSGAAPYAPGPLTDLAGQLERLRRIGQ